MLKVIMMDQKHLSVTFWANRINSHDNVMDRSRITPYSAGSTLDVRI